MTGPRISGMAGSSLGPVHTGPILTPASTRGVSSDGAPVAPVGRPTPVPVTLAGRLAAAELGDLVSTANVEMTLEAATRALQHGRADDVLGILDPIWRDDVASDSPWYLRAAALEVLGRTSDAESILRDAIARLPRSAALLYLLGVHAAARGQGDAALVASAHALQVHPEEPLLLVQRAALRRAAGAHDDADALIARARWAAPDLPVDRWLELLTERAMPASAQFGLTLLEPTASAAARITRGHVRATPLGATYIASSQTHLRAVQRAQSRAVAWPALLLGGGVILAAMVPPLRAAGVALAVAGLIALARSSSPRR
jgi:tetratricopeptide (TPR) repeat protein